MADDQNQRSYRSNEPPMRRAPAANPVSGNDPLAELARLIGQTDPFAEFGRDSARRGVAPTPVTPPPSVARNFGASDYFAASKAAATHPAADAAPAFALPGPARQPYAGGDLHLAESETAVEAANDAGDFEPDPYHPSNEQFGAEEEDFYEDAPPSKKRMGIMAIAAVFALVVIGTAGAFGYRAIFGSSQSATPPPVIKADTAPSKIVPATASKAANKLITDRVTDRAQDEKLVSREEQPVAIKNNPAAPMPQAQVSAPSAAAQVPTGSGVMISEPKKIHTIAIRPDQASTGEGQPGAAAAAAPAPPAQMAPLAPARTAPPPARVATNAAPAANPAPPRPPEPRATTAESDNAPLSLSPDAPAARAPARTAAVAAPARMAPAAATTASAAAGSYAVQVSSQRSEAEAQSAFRGLQAKYPAQLGNRQVLIHKVDLGAKGTYYRAMVGPFYNASEAGELCSGLKAAGGQCLIQRN